MRFLVSNVHDLTMDVKVKLSEVVVKTVDSSIYNRNDIWPIDIPFFQRWLGPMIIFWSPKNVS